MQALTSHLLHCMWHNHNMHVLVCITCYRFLICFICLFNSFSDSDTVTAILLAACTMWNVNKSILKILLGKFSTSSSRWHTAFKHLLFISWHLQAACFYLGSSLSYCSTFSQFWHFVIKKDLHFLIHPSVAWYQMSQAKRMKRYLEINLQHFTSHKWVHCNTHDRFWVETIYYINRILKSFTAAEKEFQRRERISVLLSIMPVKTKRTLLSVYEILKKSQFQIARAFMIIMHYNL